MGHRCFEKVASSFSRVQVFLSIDEHKSTRSNKRLIQAEIPHSWVNSHATRPSSEQIKERGQPSKNNDQIQLLKATLEFPGIAMPLFKDVNISIPRGLTMIVGAASTGKSQFVKMLLDEVSRTRGLLFIERGGTIAYCAQRVWLQSVSIKDNILGQNPYNQDRYNRVVTMCLLEDDFASLPDGGETAVNDNGSNLTASQQRKVVSI